MRMEKSYEVTIGVLKRKLPIIPISSTVAIASFVLLGDTEMTSYAAAELVKRITEPFDEIVTMESKGIPLAEEISKITHRKNYVVLRKSVKGYMGHPISVPVKSITTNESQTLVLDGNDVLRLTDKRILLVDDVISTGGSLTAAENLMAKVDANVVCKCAILAEGTAATRDDITVLGSLPVFSI